LEPCAGSIGNGVERAPADPLILIGNGNGIGSLFPVRADNIGQKGKIRVEQGSSGHVNLPQIIPRWSGAHVTLSTMLSL
jgi:hypothetical protein